jgi:Arm DNA-binding domain
MTRINRLDADKVASAGPGMHPDGAGLYLQATPSADGSLSKSWIFRFSVDGRERKMGLGSLTTISLEEARDKARLCRQQRLDGIDPIERRRAKRKDGRTFKEAFFALARHKEQTSEWGRKYGREQYGLWVREIARAIGKLDILLHQSQAAQIILDLAALDRISCGQKVRRLIEAALDFAGYTDHTIARDGTKNSRATKYGLRKTRVSVYVARKKQS